MEGSTAPTQEDQPTEQEATPVPPPLPTVTNKKKKGAQVSSLKLPKPAKMKRLLSPRGLSGGGAGDHPTSSSTSNKDKEDQRQQAHGENGAEEEQKERRSLDYTRGREGDEDMVGDKGHKHHHHHHHEKEEEEDQGKEEEEEAQQRAKKAAQRKHARKASWDHRQPLHHQSPVEKVKRGETAGGAKLERRNSRNFEALVLAEGGSSPRSSFRARTSFRAPSALAASSSSSSKPQNHYFVLRIEEARNLRKPSVLGKPDPYCKFDIIPSGIIGARTSTIRRSLSPQWHEQFVGHRYFGMDGEPKPKTFSITVMNNKSFSSDEVLGRAVIPFTDSVDNWFPLEGEGAQGELRVILRFFNSDEGKVLAKIPRDHLSDVENLCAEWEKAVAVVDQGSEVVIPMWDIPCFFNINKIWTLFQYAVSKDNADLVAHLHKLGCNIDARDQTGNTALHIAAKKRLQKQINNLIRLGVDRGVENYLGGKDYKEMLRMFEDEEDGSYLL